MTSGAPITHLAIIGGGSAGWMTAAAVANAVKGKCRITLVESEEIGTVGVGEATIPPIKLFNQTLGIDEATFIRQTHGSFKLGIQFIDWARKGQSYFHPFGQYGRDFDQVPLHHFWLALRAAGDNTPIDDYCMAWGAAKQNKFDRPMRDPRQVQSTFDYAYHFDTHLYAKFLRHYAEGRGVKRLEGKVVHVEQDGTTGHLQSVSLESGEEIAADFFVDCTGFSGLLIEGVLKTGYEDWSHWLPADRAVAVPCERVAPFTPYTKATAKEAGWQWRIPLQHRVGNGYVYSSQYCEADDAEATLLESLEGKPLAEPRYLRFTTGRRRKYWNGNCVAIGLSAGFMEPLESTSLHLIQTGITRFLALFPGLDYDPLAEEEYNRLTAREYERIRDFLVLHYHATTRDDAPLWQYVRTMNIPESLRYKIEHFRRAGRIVADELDLFRNPSWLAVYLGQEVMPEAPTPLTSLRDLGDAREKMSGLARVIDQVADAMPTHQGFIDQHCAIPAPA